MGVTKSRVAQIECDEMSSVEAIAGYVQALGGRLQISAVFGDGPYILRGADTHAAYLAFRALLMPALGAVHRPAPSDGTGVSSSVAKASW